MNYNKISFGKVSLNADEHKFYLMLNNEIPYLCASLPAPVQTEAMLFMMNYAGITIGDNPEYYENFYVPAWSILYWLQKANSSRWMLNRFELENAVRVQALAMILHSLDDHLHDGQIQSSHLLLLIRSQAWMTFINSIQNMSDSPERMKLAEKLIDDYYSSISLTEDNSLEQYLEIFRKQMSTWYIAPLLSAKILSDDKEFHAAVDAVFRSFMCAWRIIDDINDIPDDILSGSHTAVYLSLTHEGKILWDNIRKDYPIININTLENSEVFSRIFSILTEHDIIKSLIDKACFELETAVSLSIQHGMSGLADEYSAMAMPLKSLLNEK